MATRKYKTDAAATQITMIQTIYSTRAFCNNFLQWRTYIRLLPALRRLGHCPLPQLLTWASGGNCEPAPALPPRVWDSHGNRNRKQRKKDGFKCDTTQLQVIPDSTGNSHTPTGTSRRLTMNLLLARCWHNESRAAQSHNNSKENRTRTNCRMVHLQMLVEIAHQHNKFIFYRCHNWSTTQPCQPHVQPCKQAASRDLR